MQEKTSPSDTPPQSYPDLENSSPFIPPQSTRKRATVVVLVILGFLVFGLTGYFIGVSVNPLSFNQKEATPPGNSPTSNPTAQPTPPPDATPSLGQTTVSFLETPSEIYLKTSTDLFDKILEFPNNKSGTLTRIFSQDNPALEPTEIDEADVPPGQWKILIKEPVGNPTKAASILVSDELFSFKKSPVSGSFLFAVSWSRSASQSAPGAWSPTRFERILYLYDRNAVGEKLKKAAVFDKTTAQYSFPKIDTFSPDGRFASIMLFACWGCGGHTPETYLLDTQTLKTKNIGRVSYFEWKSNGSYGYKDYIVIECSKPGPGECNQNPDSLPLKTGTL